MPDSFATHPANLTPTERTRAVAALLAIGLLRRPCLGALPAMAGPLQKSLGIVSERPCCSA